MSQIVELNGSHYPVDAARVGVSDVGLLYGIGLFETMRAYSGRVFRLQAHLERLLASARALELPIDPQSLPDDARVQRLLQANELHDARLRLTVTGGSPSDPGTPPTVLLTAATYQPYPEEYRERGMTVLLSDQRQPSAGPLAGHKTTCYWARLHVLHQAQLRGCGEALWFTPDGRLAEGCISNMFVARNGTLHTPPADTPVLAGITRGVIIELCRELNVTCRETALTINDLLDADEALVCNSLMGILPVCRVERKGLGDERVGPLTRRLVEAYEERVAQETRKL